MTCSVRSPKISQNSMITFLIKILIFALLYFLFGVLGLFFPCETSGLTIVWPASGLAFATLLCFNKNLWPGIIFGMLLLALYTGIPFFVALIAGVGSVLEALFAVYIYTKYVNKSSILKISGLLIFTVIALVSPMISATIGSYIFHFYLPMNSEIYITWLFWWLGNSIGLFIVGSFFLTLFALKEEPIFESALTEKVGMSGNIMIIYMIFASIFAISMHHQNISIIIMFFTLPVAAILGLIKGTITVARANIIIMLSIIFTGYSISSFPYLTHNTIDEMHSINEVYVLIAFLSILSFTGLLFAAIRQELDQNKLLGFKSTHDSLTGLYNREGLYQSLREAQLSLAEKNTQHVILFLDLDKFKLINDMEGHTVGDDMLIKVANAISTHVRNRDCVARWGGDEFAVLFWYCSYEQAKINAEKICQSISQQKIIRKEKTYTVSASIGLLLLDKPYDSIASLINKIDQAVYEAKEKGGNQIISIAK